MSNLEKFNLWAGIAALSWHESYLVSAIPATGYAVIYFGLIWLKWLK